jgi:cytochrome c
MRKLMVVALGAGLGWWTAAGAQDAAQAEALMKKSGCMKCHAVSAKKEGPSFKDVAAKYKGKPDGVAAVTRQITASPKMKIDGREELHDALKTKNEAEIKNAVAYILSR